MKIRVVRHKQSWNDTLQNGGKRFAKEICRLYLQEIDLNMKYDDILLRMR